MKMKWKADEQGESYTSGDYRLVLTRTGWHVFHSEKLIRTTADLADAKWWAKDHYQALHVLRLEASGNDLVSDLEQEDKRISMARST